MICHARLVLVIVHVPRVTPVNPQRRKSAIARAHLISKAPLSQVHMANWSSKHRSLSLLPVPSVSLCFSLSLSYKWFWNNFQNPPILFPPALIFNTPHRIFQFTLLSPNAFLMCYSVWDWLKATCCVLCDVSLYFL